jgi:RHS repeat-associated protein
VTNRLTHSSRCRGREYRTKYVYDGMRVIQERDGSNVPTVSHTRGTDLSGSLEGAGGIGGLLARSHGYSAGNWSTHNYYHADGNGNITYLVNSSQTLAAKYRYDPYGNTISSSGSLASANVYRFSSKEIHVNSGLYYYGYRWYAPNLQRWLNRDPLEEVGGINLYSFVNNSPIGSFDPFGESVWSRIQGIRSMIRQAISRAINSLMKGCGKSFCQTKTSCKACCGALGAASFAAVHAATAAGGRACVALAEDPPLAAACALTVGYLHIDAMLALGQALGDCMTRCDKLPK